MDFDFPVSPSAQMVYSECYIDFNKSEQRRKTSMNKERIFEQLQHLTIHHDFDKQREATRCLQATIWPRHWIKNEIS